MCLEKSLPRVGRRVRSHCAVRLYSLQAVVSWCVWFLPIPPSGSPAQRELPQNQPLLSLYRAAPRSGSSPRSSLFSPYIEQPRAAGASPETGPSFHQSGSPAQRKFPEKQAPASLHQSCSPAQREVPRQKQPLLSINNPAAPRSGISLRNMPLPPSIQQPRAAGIP